MNSAAPPTALDAARACLNLGWAPIPVPHKSKSPAIRNWQHLKLTESDLTVSFPGTWMNVGVLLGEPSQGLVDIDLDTQEAQRLAPSFLPFTGAVFGRVSSPAAHWLYVVADETSTIRYQDASAKDRERGTLLEYRSTGAQTLIPPSVHPSGEAILWHRRDRPSPVSADDLKDATSRLAAATLLARRWPQGSRHDITMALTGGLLRAGWTPRRVEEFILAVADAAGDEEIGDRQRAIHSTIAALDEGSRTTGWPRLATILGDQVVAQVRRWLSIEGPIDAPDSPSPSRPLAAVPPFPVDALPPLAREFVVAGAAALGCPPDFIAPHLFAFTGAVAGSSRRIELKAGYEVTPIFWVGVIGRPGTVKSPALAYARRPVDQLQRDAWTRFQSTVAEWEQRPAAERGPRPQPEHFFATDTTTEAIATSLMRSRGIAVIHDELAGWVKSFDAYRKGGDRQTWLSSWSGTPLKPNRKTGDPIFVSDPVACVLGGIQPDVLESLAGEAKHDDGFVPRLLLSWPDAEPSPWSDKVVPPGLVDRMVDHFRHLRLPGDVTRTTRLEPGAIAAWTEWFNENQLLLKRTHGLAAGWGAKAPIHLARIALVLHLLTHPPGRVGESEPLLPTATLEDAISIVEYYRGHLARVLPAFNATPAPGHAGLLPRVRRALGRSAYEWVGRAELAVRLGGHESAEDVSVALERLRGAGDAERQTAPTGGRPREEWRLIPPGNHLHAAPLLRRGMDVDQDAERNSPLRDKGELRTVETERPDDSDFSRSHVFTGTGRPAENDLPAGWERWEEGE